MTMVRYFIILMLLLSFISLDTGINHENSSHATDSANFGAFIDELTINNSQNRFPTSNKLLWEKIFEEVNQDMFFSFVKQLSHTIGPRPYGSDNNDLAVSWTETIMEDISQNPITVEIWGEYQSIIGILEGYDENSEEIVIVGGHMDSVAAAPGADDNASGTALVLETLRVLSQYHFPCDIYFMAFNAEENGLWGSAEVAQILANAGVSVKMMFNADMILFDDVGTGARVNIYQSNSDEMRVAEIIQNASHSYGEDIFTIVQGSGGGSDHASFRAQGFNAIFSIETFFSRNSHYHSASDTYDQPEYNYSMGADVAASFASAVAQISYENVSSTTDYDNDSLSDADELKLGTDLTDSDTDDDDLLDGEEFHIYKTNPLEWDSDSDKLSDGEEIIIYETEALDPDSDKDGIWDGDEVMVWSTNPWKSDSDSDGLTDYEEIIIYNTNPRLVDSDSDELSDGDEVNLGTDPKVRDSDGDKIPDGEEVTKGWDPLDSADPGDTDQQKGSESPGFQILILLVTLGMLSILFRMKKGD